MSQVPEMIRRWPIVLACCCATALAPARGAGQALATAAPAEPGSWKERDLDFDYMGYTAHYTCDGLRERVLLVLRLLGARAGATTALGCADSGHRLERFPYVHLHFAALLPVEGAAPSGPGTPPRIAGQWHSVNLVGFGKLDPNECELIEQVLEKLVPLFAARNVDKVAACVPHQETRALALHLDVFGPQAAAAP